MRVFLFTCLFLTFGACKALPEGPAKISGKFESGFNNWLYLVRGDAWNLRAEIVDSTKVNNDGTFSFETDCPKLSELMISGRGFFVTSVFLKNGVDLQLNISGQNNALKVDFVGIGSEMSKFWSMMSKRFLLNGGFNTTYRDLVTNNEPAEFKEKWLAYGATQKSVADSFFKATKTDAEFQAWVNSFTLYSNRAKLFTYLFHKPQIGGLEMDFITPDASYFDFTKELDLKKVSFEKHAAFNDYVYAWVMNDWMRNGKNGDATFAYITKDLKGEVRDLAGAHILKELIQNANNRTEYDELRKLIASYKKLPATPKYVAFIDQRFNEKASLAPGSPAPDFSLENMAGEKVSLSSLNGKVVVIDFWGTWCGPCKKELPYSKVIEEHYRERSDVVFLFVALEHGSKEPWIQFIKQNNLPGLHLYTTGGSPELSPYKITSVPRYVIVDKKGNIYNSNASRPSQNMADQIEKALELD